MEWVTANVGLPKRWQPNLRGYAANTDDKNQDTAGNTQHKFL